MKTSVIISFFVFIACIGYGQNNAKKENEKKAEPAKALSCPPPLANCNGNCYDPYKYNCIDGVICKIGLKVCAGQCYDPYTHKCENGKIVPIVPKK